MQLGIAKGATNFINSKSRYKNAFSDSNYIFMAGDAITETAGWYNSSSVWLGSPALDARQAALIRAKDGGIFSYFGRVHWNSNPANIDAGYCEHAYHSRAVIVQGQGI